MATHTAKTVSKPSFATIAAMAPPTQNGNPISEREKENSSSKASPTRLSRPPKSESPSAVQLHRELQDSMSRLAVKEPSLATNVLNEQQKSNISRVGLRCDDEQTQVSSSSTKPASLDGKSTTSGVFAGLDEKESLRPDDSASVKAADDEDYGSGPASGAPNSRVGSEAGSRAFRDQFYEITENIGSGPHRMHPLGRRVVSGIEEEGPQITRPPLPSALPVQVTLPPQLVAPNGPLIDHKYEEPDEKLFEALQSPKDRLFLLKLEQEVINFVRDSTESMIDLPPCNSFCRLLAHKLADYYALTHFVDNAVSSVRLFRTPYCRLPPPLSSLTAKASTPIDTAQSSQPAMKIMRRAGLGRASQNADSGATTAEASATPSKAGSETGDDSQRGTGVASPTDSNIAKDKSVMTREEREAKYKETRERIFGPESENADSNEAVNEVSRTSSRNEKKKKKQKNNDDGFEARSQFNAYYPQMTYTPVSYDQAANPPAYYSPYAMQPAIAMGQPGTMGTSMFNHGYQQGYQPMPNSQGFPTNISGNSTMIGYDMQNTPMYNHNQQVPPTQYYPQMQQGYTVGQQSPATSSPALSNNGQFPRPQSQMSDHQWSQNGYTYTFQPHGDQPQYFPHQVQNQNQNAIAGLQTVPYQYGQLPMHPGLQGAKSQHPLPGSYNSKAFNPQTRAFVPNGGSFPTQTGHRDNGPSHHIMRSPAAPMPNGGQYPTYIPQVPTYPQVAPMPAPSQYHLGHDARTQGARKSSSQSNSTQSPAQSSLSKWGTPAHLPPKPPPPETPSMPETQHSLPLNNQFNVNVQPMHGGQPMPSFQNGVYSIPSANPQAT